ncbi:hypothetical protein E2562_003042 [Oryza meyeriana var. granulata]|uniref:HVA22-like protein n=1 Tax=Oryza meyeriana var. granulata TaxID=110450 RepID=A0A6G1DDT3_9ORYZ|nr:hypothetical protein E2562_003042 [Oryza meyeriana var. granulata]
MCRGRQPGQGHAHLTHGLEACMHGAVRRSEKMMGGFLSRVLLLAFGYAYPAYECYKTVELNKPEIEQLIFWCQYWILVALMTVLERFGDFTISCHHLRSQGNNPLRSASIAARQAAMAQQSHEAKTVPSSPKIKRQASSAKAAPVASTKSTVAAAPSTTKPDADATKKNEAAPASLQVPAPATNADVPALEPSAPPLPEAEEVDKIAIDEADDAVEGTEGLDPVPGETVEERPMEETIRVTRAKLRRRAAAEDSAGN